MKKISLVVLTAAALCACGQTQKQTISAEEAQTILSSCETVSAAQGTVVVKCPVSEQLTAIAAADKNAVFANATEEQLADTSAMYVSVSDKCMTVLVPGSTIAENEMNAVQVCVEEVAAEPETTAETPAEAAKEEVAAKPTEKADTKPAETPAKAK